MKLVRQNFWIQVYILTMVSINLKFTGNQKNNLHIGHQKFLKNTKKKMILGYLHRSNCISSNFSEEIRFIFHKYEKADYPN